MSVFLISSSFLVASSAALLACACSVFSLYDITAKAIIPTIKIAASRYSNTSKALVFLFFFFPPPCVIMMGCCEPG